MAAQLGAAVFQQDGVGMSLPGPWLCAGVGLGFLILGGMGLFPFVLLGNLICAHILLPPVLGPVRVVWPLLLSCGWMIVAFEVRRVNGVQRPWSMRETSYFAFCVFLCSLVCSALGAALLKSGPNGSVLSFHALALATFEPQFLGALLGAPLLLFICGGFRDKGQPRVLLQQTGNLELLCQLIGLVLCVWLVGHTEASAWAPAFVFLVWLALRQGLPGACLAALVLACGVAQHRELTLPDMDGFRPIFAFEISISIVGLALGAWADENRRKRQRLQESCDRTDVLLEHAGLGIWQWSPGRPLYFEGAWHHFCSLPPGTRQLGAEAWYALIHPDDQARVRSRREAHLRGELGRYELEFRIRSSSGFYRWVLDRGVVLERDQTGRGTLMIGMILDLSSRKHAEHHQMRFLELLEGAADPIAATDLHGNVFYANKALTRLHGERGGAGVQSHHICDFFSESAAKTLLCDILPKVEAQGVCWLSSELLDQDNRKVPVSVCVFLQKDSQGQARSFGYMFRTWDNIGLPKPGSSGGSGALAASASLMDRERQEGLRQLAGGAVHTFNNVLMAIMGNAFLARKNIPADDPSRHYFAQIDQATQRGSQFCTTLQLMAGKVPPSASKVDLNAHIQGLLPVLLRDTAGGRPVDFVPTPDLPAVAIDPGQFERLLRHLVLNALESLQPGLGGVRLHSFLLSMDPAKIQSPAPLGAMQEGPHWILEVSDDGVGIDPQLHSRIFDPFFTTKSGHKGLGLAEVAGVMRAHNGCVLLDSVPGAGTTVRVCFPLAQRRKGQGTRPPMAPPRTEWQGSGQVLVIDDEETVLEVVASMLESLGFSPLVAKDGREGLQVLRQHASNVRLILLDYSMPLMDGEATLVEIGKLRPEIPVIFMSGHESRELKARVVGEQIAGVLGKPFPLESLKASLRSALEAS